MTSVEVFVDPVCPFAYIASQWIREVARLRPLDLRFGVMALAILNQDPADPYEADRGTESAWRPVRVAEALAASRGQRTLDEYLEEFGRRYHVERQRGREEVLRGTLRVLGAPEYHSAADDHAWDEAVAGSHRRALGAVAGSDVGTPIIHIDGIGVFGPVLTEVPVGEDALKTFDAVHALVRSPAFVELKRGRPGT